jgi:anti-sigma-K factor RskA
MLAVCLWLLVARDPLQQPNADYVAVLTNDSGAPQLTVLTATGGAQLWLKWEAIEIADEKNLQLWAVSKRDGQIRPLGVFAQTDIQQLPLTVPQWRLIKDSSHLILTEEDVGGSPLDEPSDVILAKGVCVLLAQVKKAI